MRPRISISGDAARIAFRSFSLFPGCKAVRHKLPPAKIDYRKARNSTKFAVDGLGIVGS